MGHTAVIEAPAAPTDDPIDDDDGCGRGVRAGTIVGVALVVGGLALGLQALGDNSFLTHLATGRLILEDGGVPDTDPYSFTAAGAPWVVQSWLASVLYAGADRLGGALGLLVLTAAVTCWLTSLVHRMARRADGLLAHLGLGALALGVGAGVWSERPLLLGLVFFALALLAAEGEVDPRWLVPVGWLWANTHGSFPLGLVLVGVLALGRRLDGERPTSELRALGLLSVGVAAGAIGPLGLDALVFPVEHLSRGSVLATVVEWQSPSFTGLAERLFLVQIAVSVLALCRRPSWRAGLVVALVVPLALLASRNVAPASLALLLVSAPALTGIGSLVVSTRMRAGRVAVATLLAGGALFGVAALRRPAFQLADYPVAELEWLEGNDLRGEGSRLVAPDYVGNYLTALRGREAQVFIDDRYDLYPKSHVEDYVELLAGGPDWHGILDRTGATVVVWRRDEPLTSLLEEADGWRVARRSEDWVVAVRR